MGGGQGDGEGDGVVLVVGGVDGGGVLEAVQGGGVLLVVIVFVMGLVCGREGVG